jgi:hypothetical protein
MVCLIMYWIGIYIVEKEDLHLNQINVVDLNKIFSITPKEDIEELFITLECNLKLLIVCLYFVLIIY